MLVVKNGKLISLETEDSESVSIQEELDKLNQFLSKQERDITTLLQNKGEIPIVYLQQELSAIKTALHRQKGEIQNLHQILTSVELGINKLKYHSNSFGRKKPNKYSSIILILIIIGLIVYILYF